jgi:septum formation protein
MSGRSEDPSASGARSRAVPRLLLASASPRRADVLRQIGLPPDGIRAMDVDESYLPGETPAAHVERLARAKAEALAALEPGALVIGGDTVVVHDGEVLVKPLDESDARAMLERLSGRTHEVVSGVAVAGPHGAVSAVSRTRVHMRAYDAPTAAAYVATGEPMDKAGGYGIQGMGAALVAGIDGDYYTVVGFPVGAFLELLERAGWRCAFGRLTPVEGE